MAFVPDAPAAGRFVPDDDVMKGVKAASREKKADPNPTSAKNLAGAAVEPLLSLGSGAVAGPASGLAGILGSIMPGPEGQGAKWAGKVGHGMTYAPRTTGGQNAMSAISYPFEKIGEGADSAGGKATDVTGSPAVGAGVSTLLQILPQILASKGARAGTRAFDRGMDAVGPELGIRSPLPPPPIDPQVKTLMDRGVPVTPGEVKGGKWKRAEEALESIPIAGAPVKAARSRGVEAFNDAAVNDSLKPVGEKLPKGMKGNEAIAWAREKLGDKYEELLPKLKGSLDNAPPKGALAAPGQLGAPPKPSFRQELEQLRAMGIAGTDLGDAQKALLNRIIDKEVIAKFTKQGTADGEALKKVESRLTEIAKGYAKSEDYQVRDLGLAVKEIQASMRRMMEDVNPKHRGELAKINEGYAKFKIAQQAAGSQGARDGVFTPPQYDRAVRNKDSSKDKRAYSEGTANQQDLSPPHRHVEQLPRLRDASAGMGLGRHLVGPQPQGRHVRTAGKGIVPRLVDYDAAHEVPRLGRPHRARRQHELPRHAGAVSAARLSDLRPSLEAAELELDRAKGQAAMKKAGSTSSRARNSTTTTRPRASWRRTRSTWSRSPRAMPTRRSRTWRRTPRACCTCSSAGRATRSTCATRASTASSCRRRSAAARSPSAAGSGPTAGRVLLREFRVQEADGRRSRAQHRRDGHALDVREEVEAGRHRAEAHDQGSSRPSITWASATSPAWSTSGRVLAVRVHHAPGLAHLPQPDGHARGRSRAVDGRQAAGPRHAQGEGEHRVRLRGARDPRLPLLEAHEQGSLRHPGVPARRRQEARCTSRR
jgi:hypothetical protein